MDLSERIDTILNWTEWLLIRRTPRKASLVAIAEPMLYSCFCLLLLFILQVLFFFLIINVLYHVTTSPKSFFRVLWRVGEAVVGRGNAGWKTSKSRHPCLCQNWSPGPPEEKTGRGSVLNRPSCFPDDPLGQRTEVKWTVKQQGRRVEERDGWQIYGGGLRAYSKSSCTSDRHTAIPHYFTPITELSGFTSTVTNNMLCCIFSSVFFMKELSSVSSFRWKFKIKQNLSTHPRGHNQHHILLVSEQPHPVHNGEFFLILIIIMKYLLSANL